MTTNIVLLVDIAYLTPTACAMREQTGAVVGWQITT